MIHLSRGLSLNIDYRDNEIHLGMNDTGLRQPLTYGHIGLQSLTKHQMQGTDNIFS